jgi:hypothetical protein
MIDPCLGESLGDFPGFELGAVWQQHGRIEAFQRQFGPYRLPDKPSISKGCKAHYRRIQAITEHGVHLVE